MAARMKIMVAVLAVAWVGQTWAAGAEQTQPRKPDAPRPGPEDRMAMLRAAATDRWMPQDAVTTLERAIRQLEMTEAQTQ